MVQFRVLVIISYYLYFDTPWHWTLPRVDINRNCNIFFGAMQKSELQDFALEGHPIIQTYNLKSFHPEILKKIEPYT